MHCVWMLLEDDGDDSTRWKEIKANFSRSLPKTEIITPVMAKRSERGIWQRRFWEHTIRNDADFAAHIDYVYLNPYKHGLVAHVRDWPYSSFHRYDQDGIYRIGWMTDDG